MRKLFAVAVTLLLFIFTWVPVASAEEAIPAVAIAQAKVDGVSRISEAYASAYADETMTRGELVAKVAILERNYNDLMAQSRLPAQNERQRAILDIQTAVTKAELKLINLRLARLSMETCATGELPCNASIASARELQESAEAKDAYARALNTIRFAVP